MALTNLNGSPAWTQQSVNNAGNGRLHIGALLPSAAATTGLTAWRDGVIATTNQGGSNSIPNDMQIKASGSPSLTLTCEAGHCVITRSGQGPFLCVLPTQGNVTLAAADTVNPRIDLIVAQIYDTALSDTMPTTPALAAPGGVVIRAITGTPAGSPVVPTVSAGQIPLAKVTVVANDTTIVNGDIVDLRKSAFNPGGARPLLPGDLMADAGTVTGDVRYTSTGSDNGGVSVWTGTRWRNTGTAKFASVSARDAEITSPQIGDWAFTSDLQLQWVYSSTGWVAREEQLVGYYLRTTSSNNVSSGTAIGVCRVDNISAVTGHPLRIEYCGHPTSSVGSDSLRVDVRYAVGSTASASSTVLYNSATFAPVDIVRNWSTVFIPPSTGTYSFALCIARSAGTGNCSLFADSIRGTELKIHRLRTDITSTGTNL